VIRALRTEVMKEKDLKLGDLLSLFAPSLRGR